MFAIRLKSGEILQISENGNICEPKILGILPESTDSWQFFTQDGRIYWIQKMSNETDLISCTLKGEDVLEIPVYSTGSSQIVSAAGGRNGYAVILERSRVNGKPALSLSEMELQTGKITKLCTLENDMKCVCYDVETDSIILSGEDSLFKWSRQNGSERIASTLSGDAVMVTSTADGYAVLVDNSIAFRSRENAAKSCSLKICAQYVRSEDYREFFTENPNISVEFVKPSGNTPEEQFIDDMVNRNGSIDLYLLSDISFLSTIKGKQYFVDLSGSAFLSQLVGDMYEPFRNLFSCDGNICAIPQTVYVSMLGYNPDFFKKYGLQVPESIGELLNLTENWIDNYADEYPEALFDPFSNGITLQYILTNYMAEMEANGKPTIMSTPELEQLLEQYRRVKSKFSSLPISGSFDEYALNIMDIPCRGNYQLMQLSVISGNEPVICGSGIEMRYLVVNPYSVNTDAALKFAECIAKSWDSQLQLVLMKSKVHTVENPEYAGTNS